MIETKSLERLDLLTAPEAGRKFGIYYHLKEHHSKKPDTS
jgi:hypothetical protein